MGLGRFFLVRLWNRGGFVWVGCLEWSCSLSLFRKGREPSYSSLWEDSAWMKRSQELSKAKVDVREVSVGRWPDYSFFYEDQGQLFSPEDT